MRLIGVEAGGRGHGAGRACGALPEDGRRRCRACCRVRTRYVLQNDAGQVATTHSVSAGLDYASVGPEHAMLHDSRPGGVYVGDRMRRRWRRP